MNKVEELLQIMGNDVVEKIDLGDICRIRTGKLNANAKDEDGIYPFFTCDANPYRINEYAFDTSAILISGNGSQVGHLNKYDGKFNAYQRTYVLDDFKGIERDYLFHFMGAYLKPYIMVNCKKGSVPYITLPMLQNFKVPVPPLEVQREIVRVLDSFTFLTAELTAELTARKKQYEYYKDRMLMDAADAQLVKLSDIATVIRGGNFQKKDFVEEGKPCIHYGQMYTHFGITADNVLTFVNDAVFAKSKIATKGDIVMAVTSENVEDVCSCTAWLGDEDIAVSGHTAIIKHNQNAKFMSYYFHSSMFFEQKKKLAHGTKVIEVTPSKLLDIEMLLPSIEEQERIVTVLDKFYALCNDITEGIPAEIDARNKQYDYYRNKLFEF